MIAKPEADRPSRALRRRLLAGTALAGATAFLLLDSATPFGDARAEVYDTVSNAICFCVTVTGGTGAPVVLQADPGYVTSGLLAGLSLSTNLSLTLGDGQNASSHGPVAVIPGVYQEVDPNSNSFVNPSPAYGVLLTTDNFVLGTSSATVTVKEKATVTSTFDASVRLGVPPAALLAVSGRDVTIVNNGTVSGTNDTYGILAVAEAGSLTIAGTGSVSSERVYGIYAVAASGLIADPGSRTGDIRILDLGEVRSRDQSGIWAENMGTGNVVMARIGRVSGGPDAIHVVGLNSNIFVGADPGSTTDAQRQANRLSQSIVGRNGIYASSLNGSIDIETGSGGTVTATNGFGITANASRGSVTIDVGDTVRANQIGVLVAPARSARIGGAGDVIAVAQHAIFGIVFSDAGSLTITGTGATTSQQGRGISAIMGGGTGELRISRSGDITAGLEGVYANNSGTGNTVLTGLGKVTGGAGSLGIYILAGGETFVGVDPASTTDAQKQADRLANVVSGGTGLQAQSTGGTVRVATAGSGRIVGSNGDGALLLGFSGSVQLDADGDIVGSSNGVYAQSFANGSVFVGGAGDFVGLSDSGITALSRGALTVAGTGKTSGASGAVYASIASGTGNLRVSRSGAMSTAGDFGLRAVNGGTGRIVIAGIGPVTAAGGENAIGIAAVASGGDVFVGADPDSSTDAQRQSDRLSQTVTATTGLVASTRGIGSVRIATGPGGLIEGTGLDGLVTLAQNGGTSIDIGAGSGVKGARLAISALTANGNVVVDNAGLVSGSIQASVTGTGTATFNNSGTLVLAEGQANSGFAILNRPGGVLTGAGNFGAVTAQAGSILRPGDRANPAWPPGAMTVSSLTMQAGSVIEMRAGVSTSGTARLLGDAISATGPVVLNGTTLSVTPWKGNPAERALWRPGLSHTVISSTDSVTGSVVAVTDLAFLSAEAKVDPVGKAVTLTFVPVAASAAASILPGRNQRSAYFAIAPFQESPPSAQAQALLDRVNTLTPALAPAALDQLSGANATVAQDSAFSGITLVGATVLRQALVAGGVTGGGAPSIEGGALGYAPDDGATTSALAAVTPHAVPGGATVAPSATRWRAWATTLGAQTTTQAHGGIPRISANDWGFVSGIDVAVSPTVAVGVSVAGTSSRFSADHATTSGSAGGVLGTVYAVTTAGPLYAAGSMGVGRFTTRTSRTLPSVLDDQRYSAVYGSTVATSQAELGWRLGSRDGLSVTPFVAVQATVLGQEAHAERAGSGDGAGLLATAARNAWSVPGQLGLRGEYAFAVGGAWQAMAQARAAWVHELSPARTARSNFVALPDSSFTVRGPSAAENLARLTAGLTVANATGLSLFATLTSDLAPHARSAAVQGGIRVGW